MKQVRTVRAKRCFKLPGGNETNDLWVEEREDEQGHPVQCSTWEPDEDERKAIAEGANVELLVWGKGQPPVSMATSTAPLGALDVEVYPPVLDLTGLNVPMTEEAAKVAGEHLIAEARANGGVVTDPLKVRFYDVVLQRREVTVQP